MKTAYIFHDSFNDPFGEWYPWMKSTLESMGYLVIVPNFPTPAGQSYESWKSVIRNHLTTFTSDTLFIGHGTGALFAMRLVSEIPVKIRGLFLIAAYAEPIGNIGFDRINKTFYEPAFNWSLILSQAALVRVYAGAEDPFVPYALTERLAHELHETVITIPEGGHLGKAAGFTELVAVASSIRESLTELDKSISLESAPQEPETILPTDIHSIKEAADLIAGKPFVPSPKPAPAPDAVPEHPINAHTMYEDLSQVVHSNRGSVVSSILTKARTEEAAAEAASPASGKNIMYTLFSIFTFAATIGIVLYLVQVYAPAPQIPQAPDIPVLIRSEEHEKITFSNEPSFMLDQKIKNAFAKPLPDGTVRDIYYETGGTRSSFPALLRALGVVDLPIGMAAEFPESENGVPVFMHGLLVKNQVAQHFLVLRVKNYDTSFALFTEWERTLLRDIGSLMNISSDFIRTRLTQDIFADEIIQNKPVRTLRYKTPAAITFDDPGVIGAVGNTFANAVTPYNDADLILAYFFLNERTVVIVNNLDIIPELLKRYADRQIYQ